MATDPKKLTDLKLKSQALSRVALGALPIENWSCLFAPSNPVYVQDIPLRNRAFSIWFPTMYDYLEGENDLAALRAEVARRGFDCGKVFDLGHGLGQRMRAVIGLVSKNEQLFLRDRRLQNVHGALNVFLTDTPSVVWYDSTMDRIIRATLTETEYHDVILQPFNTDIRTSQARLRERVLSSAQWSGLYDFYSNNLTRTHIEQLGRETGVA